MIAFVTIVAAPAVERVRPVLPAKAVEAGPEGVENPVLVYVTTSELRPDKVTVSVPVAVGTGLEGSIVGTAESTVSSSVIVEFALGPLNRVLG